jgi:16S rRNA pseudouridine516 synthase
LKLDRLLAKFQSIGQARARSYILGGSVRVDGEIIRDRDHRVDRFTDVSLEDLCVQTGERRLCLMLHKPVGVISATRDEHHRTVIDLIDDPDKDTLHLVGRLDINTSGLVLLTNDGRWSKSLMAPDNKVPKHYRVTTDIPIPPAAVRQFANGFYFETEDLTTRPAELEILTPRTARVNLCEGRYRQVRRMFHRVGCRVMTLHRERVGNIALPDDLESGDWRRVPAAFTAIV